MLLVNSVPHTVQFVFSSPGVVHSGDVVTVYAPNGKFIIEGSKNGAGVDQVEGSMVFHAGTRRGADGSLQTAGGRVLCITSLADNMPVAVLKSYQEVEKINWEGCFFRHDIGQDLLKMMI